MGSVIDKFWRKVAVEGLEGPKFEIGGLLDNIIVELSRVEVLMDQFGETPEYVKMAGEMDKVKIGIENLGSALGISGYGSTGIGLTETSYEGGVTPEEKQSLIG